MSTTLRSLYLKVREQVSNLKKKCDPDMVARPSTRKTEASRVSGQPGLQRQFRASLKDIVKPHLKNNKTSQITTNQANQTKI